MSVDPQAPSWFSAYARSFMAAEAHAFLLHGDVDGTAYESLSQRGVLLSALAASHQVVAVYHVSVDRGITLFEPDGVITVGDQQTTRRERALALIGQGADKAKPAAQGGSMAALLGQLGPQSAPQGDPFTQANRPTEALALLGQLLQGGTRAAAVVLDYADTLVPTPAMAGKGAMAPDDRRILVSLLAWAKDPAISDNENVIFMLTRDAADIHPDLRQADSGWKAIPMALPDRARRLDYLDWYTDRKAQMGQAVALLDGLTTLEVANLTAGLSLRNLEDILLIARLEGGLTRGILKEHKDQIIAQAYDEVAEMIEPLRGGFADLGGLQWLKDYMNNRVIDPIRAGRLDDVPKAIMLAGPPGVGKTYVSRALAQETGFSAVALNASKILGGIVGQSERNLARFFAFAKALAPVIIFIDEIDQSDMAQRGNSSGNPVAKNLFSGLMQFMSDETLRGKVVTILATNRPDLLDSALTRDGRMDAIIPVLLPDRDERYQIGARQAAGQGAIIADAALCALADGTDKYSAAGIATIIREARLLATGEPCIAAEHVTSALDWLIPSGIADADYYTQIAIKAVRDKRLLPPAYRALATAAASTTPAVPALSTGRRERSL